MLEQPWINRQLSHCRTRHHRTFCRLDCRQRRGCYLCSHVSRRRRSSIVEALYQTSVSWYLLAPRQMCQKCKDDHWLSWCQEIPGSILVCYGTGTPTQETCIERVLHPVQRRFNHIDIQNMRHTEIWLRTSGIGAVYRFRPLRRCSWSDRSQRLLFWLIRQRNLREINQPFRYGIRMNDSS